MELGILSDRTRAGFERARDKGLSFVEFRVNAGEDVDVFMAELPELLELVQETGVRVGAVGRRGTNKVDGDGRVHEGELENTLKLVDACRLLECPVIITGCNYIEGISLLKNAQNAARFFDLITRYAEENAVRVAVCNCGWNNFVHSDPAWELILGDVEGLHIMYDPSHAIYRGQDYLIQAAKWGGRFAHVHLKGALRIAGQRFDDPPAGMDGTDWGAFLACLYRHGYRGGLSIEPHSDTWSGALGERGIDYTVRYFKQMLFE